MEETTTDQSLEPEERPVLSGPITLWRVAVFAALSVIVGWICINGSEINSSTEAGVIMDLPVIVGGYYGEKMEVSKSEKTILPLDTEFERRYYTSVDGQIGISCQIVLSGGEKRSLHRPEICLPGQGWEIKTADSIDVELDGGGTLATTKLLLSRPRKVSEEKTIEEQAVFLYWFVGSNTTTPYHWERIVKNSWDRVFHATNHRWAYVVIQAPVTSSYHPDGRTIDETLAIMKDFTRQVTPYFIKDKVQFGS